MLFYRPQIRIPYIMIIEAPLLEKGIHGVDAHLHMLSPIYSISYDIDAAPLGLHSFRRTDKTHCV
jgi:hypothetical protein